MKRFKCKLCGYEIEKENLDDGYVCPICGVSKSNFEEVIEVDNRVPIDDDNPSIMRIMEKCINCGICKNVCTEKVGIKYEKCQLSNKECINCGRCRIACPMVAIVPKYNYQNVMEAINDPEKIVVVSTSPAVRVALGEEFMMEAGSFVEGKMIASLKKLGFDYVLDTTFGADLTIMEEGTELVNRIKNNGILPIFTSCCPSWVKYLEINYPELLPHLSSSKSPIGMQGAIVKTYFAQKRNIEPKNIIHVALTPCVAKKYEINRPEMNSSSKYNNIKELRDTDYVITTAELGLMLRENNIDFNTLEDMNYDSLLEKGSGAGVIFGNTGGVAEAAIRTVYNIITNKNPDKNLLEFTNVRGLESVKEAIVNIEGIEIKVAVIYGITNVKPFLDKLKIEKLEYHLIEVMSCNGGCIGGGGQPLTPISRESNILTKRMEGLYNSDKKGTVRCSYQNEDIKRVYNEFLGSPNSKISKSLLHTEYTSKENYKKTVINS